MSVNSLFSRFVSPRIAGTVCLIFSVSVLSVSCNRDGGAARISDTGSRPAVQEAGMMPEADMKPGAAKVYSLQSVETSQPGKRADFVWKEGGKTVKLSDISKGKPVFLNFWATWCPPCRRELPDIVELHKEYGNKVVFIGVALENESKADKAAALVSKFAQNNNLGYINIVGDEKLIGKIAGAYGNVEAIPTTFIIGKDGSILQTLVGGKSKDDFLSELKKAL